MDKKLEKLIRYIDSPAILISTEHKKILASNNAALRHLGTKASETNEIKLPELEDEIIYLSLLEDDCLRFYNAESSKAEYQLESYGQNLALLLQTPKNLSNNELLEDFGSQQNFHFSYIHSFLTEKRNFSAPDILIKLGLIENEAELNDFNWRDHILEEDLPLYDNTITAAMEHGGSHRMRYRVKAKHDNIIEVADFCGTANEDGKWPMLVGSIVSAKRSSKKIQQVERLCLVGRLLGGMVHDFRNLLAGMQNMIEWCMSQSDSNGSVYKALNKTINYTDQARGLIKCTLQIIDGKNEDTIDKIYVGEIIKNVEEMIRHFVSPSIDISVQIEPNLPAVYGQRSMMMDMLLNLCLNACDAMSSKGHKLEIIGFQKDQHSSNGGSQQLVCISVKDDGCGMTQSQLNSIFDEYYTTKKDGAGLGLWMVKEAARSFDGQVIVDSEVGLGSTFEVQFPVVEVSNNNLVLEEKVEQKSIDIKGFSGQNRTILLIEDEPLLRDGVISWLKSLDLEVIPAADGKSGLKLFNENKDKIDLIIQDFILPGIKGEVLLETFTANHPEIPVIVVSGYPDGKDYEWIIEKGAYAFLPKPFRMEELVQTMHDALQVKI